MKIHSKLKKSWYTPVILINSRIFSLDKPLESIEKSLKFCDKETEITETSESNYQKASIINNDYFKAEPIYDSESTMNIEISTNEGFGDMENSSNNINIGQISLKNSESIKICTNNGTGSMNNETNLISIG